MKVLNKLVQSTTMAALLLAGLPAQAQEAAETLADLLNEVRTQGRQISQENKAREQEFRQNRNRQKAMLDETLAALRSEQIESDNLKQSFDRNEQKLEELSETLRIRVGDMGELFGIVRQVASEMKDVADASLVSAQHSDRSGIADRLAQATALPSINDLRELQALFVEEMIESGKVVRFDAEVEDATGITVTKEVVRIGVFNAISDAGYLSFHPEDRSLRELSRQPAGRYVNMAQEFFNTSSGAATMAVDPSRGNLLSLVIQSPSLLEQVSFGGGVGYTILVMGLIGVIIALYRLVVLQSVGRKMAAQKKSSTASTDNPLGRIFAAYESNQNVSPATLELKLDEMIMRETPKLERFQGIVKVIAGVAPLMGLLGTVVGMIKTFQTITLFGTGDPKLMADGISQALVTTVEGLIVAIPLVFLHSLVAGRSKELIEVLEEQSAGLIARLAERA